ncbi:MAG: DnaJ domain-containing protein [Myxococcales bacterium]|nr:DnaJ domain-containing protein [Myxococcales bacterium]MDH3482594.1 DnaJ domain-containing protein [Myxococcales bacterium]
MPSSVPKPLAEGALSATPFGHVLLSIQKKGLSGTLAVWPDDDQPGQDRILFRSGVPAIGRFIEPVASLDRGLLTIFPRERGPYAFYEADLVGEGDGTMRGSVDVLEVIATSLRGDVPKDAMTRVIRKLGDERQRVKSGAPLARFSLQSNEKAFVELMRAEPATAAVLIEQFGDPKVARRMLYLLAITESLEVYRPISRQKLRAVSPSSQGDRPSSPPFGRRASSGSTTPPRMRRSSPPGRRDSNRPGGDSVLPTSISNLPPAKSLSGEIVAPRQMPPPPPAGFSDEHRKRWEEVVRVISMMDRQNYFEMLGVKESADSNEIRGKYMKLAKKWHPDRLPNELSPLRPWVEEIFHLFTVARDTLANDKSRVDYQKTVMQGGGTPESERKLNVMVESAINFQKVDVLVKRRRYDEALRICDEVMEVVRKEADYPAMKAWVLMLKHGIEDDEVADEIRSLLKQTFLLNTDHVQGHFVRAHFLKRMGKHDKALKHFKKVAKLDPKNLEAIREVRIGSMRQSRGRSSAPPGKGGKRPSIFGKLFKK